MPPRRGLPRLVLGDRHGTSASSTLVARLSRAIVEQGEEAGLNHPYAGGAIVAAHGRPQQNVHAVQLEFDRAFYLDARLRVPGPGLARARLLLERLVAAAEGFAGQALAAE